jgi:hypothetical protein
MAQDSVLQREMFNPRDRSARGSGITSMVDDGSASEMTREQRLQMAKDMLAEAQMTQNPEYYFNTLAQGDRPAMTRPVASSAPPPAMQPMPPMQQMAQMQAAGVRPVGMAEGGLASFRDPRMEAVNLADLPALGASESAYMGGSREDPKDKGGFLNELLGLPGPREEELRRKLKTFAQSAGGSGDYMSKLPSTKSPTPDAQVAGGSGDYMSKIGEKSEENLPDPADKKLTELEQIKADRKAEKEKNFYLGLMQAGLAVAAGKSPDALQNIAQGGISGLQSYAGLEADSRKAEREDMAALRAQQQDEATALYREKTLGLEREKMGQDSDTIRLYKALGGGDLNKGYALTQDDENLKAAVAVSRDTMASPEAKLAAEQYIMSKIAPQNVAPTTGSRIVGVQ